MENLIRLNSYLASAGICSRREADRLIEAGRVTVDGKTAQLGEKVTAQQLIAVDGKTVQAAAKTRVLALYKPAGYVCTKKDVHAEKTVYDLLPEGSFLSYAGRLDSGSEGLLLFTNDGALSRAMMQGSGGHEKEYRVRVDHPVTGEFLQKLRDGIYLEELSVKTKPCRVKKTGDQSFTIILTQGLNRQIRRMCEACGYRVAHLLRVRVVNVTLEGLKKGSWRELSDAEVESLRRAVLETKNV